MSKKLKSLKQVDGKLKKELCDKCCRNPAVYLHTCPYAKEIGGDSETLCNCCSRCKHECRMDI